MPIGKTIEELLKKIISDEISSTEREYLLQRAEKDRDIAMLLKLHNTMKNEALVFDMADDKEFQKMRAITLNKIHRYRSKKNLSFLTTIWEKMLIPFQVPAFSIPIALIFFLGGFFIQRFTHDDDFIESINSTTLQTKNLQDSYDTPFVFSNATFREKKDGKILVSFDAERHLEIFREKDDPLVKEILAQSLLNSNTPWQRLRNISDSETIMDPKIKHALIEAMLNDKNQIVRQKSMSSLMNYPNDKDIQEALMHILVEEESVFMRLAAIDYLSNNKVSTALIEKELQTFGSKDPVVSQRIRQLKLEQN